MSIARIIKKTSTFWLILTHVNVKIFFLYLKLLYGRSKDGMVSKYYYKNLEEFQKFPDINNTQLNKYKLRC